MFDRLSTPSRAARRSTASFSPALDPGLSSRSVENSNVPSVDQTRTRETRSSTRTVRSTAASSEAAGCPVMGANRSELASRGSSTCWTYPRARLWEADRSSARASPPLVTANASPAIANRAMTDQTYLLASSLVNRSTTPIRSLLAGATDATGSTECALQGTIPRSGCRTTPPNDHLGLSPPADARTGRPRGPSRLVGDAAEASRPLLEVADRFEEVLTIEVRPEDRGEPQLRVGNLPQEEVRDPLLSARADQQIRRRHVGRVQ